MLWWKKIWNCYWNCGIGSRLECGMVIRRFKFIIDESDMIIRCVWIILNLSNEIRYE